MIYPSSFPEHIDEPAEKKVFNVLKKLDMQRYDVFYRRRFVGMHAGEKKAYEIDFIIVDLGGDQCNAILVLEVKGGIVKYNGQESCWTQDGVNMRNKDPVQQAEGNMFSLIKHYPDISRYVPFAWAICFPDERNTYSKKQIPPFLHPLQLLENSALHAIDKQLPKLMNWVREQDPDRRGTDMQTYRRVRESLLAGLGQVVPLHTRLAAEKRQLIQLTNEQVNLLQMVISNQNLAVTGPAGCGKTIMATTIAQQAREKGQKVLMLTFNRIPAANIREGFALTGEEADITVENYHRFARQQIEKAEPGWWDEHVKGGEMFWTLESPIKLSDVLAGAQPYFDVLIIDEAQDFRPEWFESLEHVLKPEGKYCLFMDEDQNIFKHFSGLPAQRQFTRFALPHNCRNTRHIIGLLEKYINKQIPCPGKTPDGAPVEFYDYKNDVEQVKILRDEWLRLVQQKDISPDRIVIIVNTKIEDSCLKDVRSFGKYPLQEVSTDTGHISAEHVNITRIRTFKGLEADMVFIADTHRMETQDKNILYTQASRARLWLGVLGKMI